MENHHGHDQHAGHHTGDFLKRFWICMVFTVPVLLLSHMIQQMADPQNSEHHIAHGVIRKLKEKGLELWASADFNYMPGIGMTGTVNGKSARAG